MLLDDKSIYHTAPNLIKLLIRPEMPTAKDFLKSCPLSPEVLDLLDHFDHYTLEAIIIHVLGMVFNSLQDFSMVRVALWWEVEQLDSSVRVQAALLKSRNRYSIKNSKDPQLKEEVSERKSEIKNTKRKSKCDHYAIGSNLVKFLEERQLVSFCSSGEVSSRIIYKEREER